MTWVAALLASVLGLAEPTADARWASCDHDALELPPPERDYQCYARLAREHDVDAVLDHLEALTGMHDDDGRLWLALGALQADYGRNPKGALTRAIDALTQSGTRRYEIQARLNLARWYSNEGNTPRARTQLEAARASAEVLDHPILTAIVEFDALGESARHIDTELLAAYRRALVAYEQLDDDAPPQVRRAGAHMLARGARTLGNNRRAAAFSVASAEASARSGDEHGALHARRAAALDRYRFQSDSYDPAARSRFRTEVKRLLEQARVQDNPLVEVSLLADLARTAAPAESRDAFARCVDSADRLGMENDSCRRGLAKALASTEPERARAMVSSLLQDADSPWTLSHTHAAKASLALAADAREDAWASWSAMFDAAERSTADQDPDARARLHARWSARYHWVAGQSLQWADASPWPSRAFDAMERMRGRELAEFSGAPTEHRATLTSIADALPDDTAMLVFQVAPEVDLWGRPGGGSWLLVIHGGSTKAYPLPDAAQLDPAIAMVAARLASAPSSLDSDPSTTLYELLLSDALADLPASVRSLVILPDGELHRLPLGALHEPGGTLLLERYAISTSPSATSWDRSRRGPPLPRAFVGFADPAPRSAPPVRLAARTRGDALGRLPGARAESSYAAEVLGGTSLVLIDTEATESALRRATDAAIVHIGAHVVVDGIEPANTRLLLASDADADGDVFLEELAALDLDGPLVVLAACEGADGELLAGEGPLSAVRALQLAGARTVVAGLWPVEDAEAAALFSAFYEALDRGETVAGALAHAQSERRAAGAPVSSWAGFVVYGDGALTVEPAPRPRAWHFALLAGLLAAAGAWFVLRPRPQRRTRRPVA